MPAKTPPASHDDTPSSSSPDTPPKRAGAKKAPRKQKPKKHWLLRALGWLLGLILAGVGAVAMLAGMALAMAYPQLPDISGLTDYRPKLPLRVLSSEGQLLGEYGEERRSYSSIRAIPKVMQDAVLAIEDARFYQHGGVDYLGVIRAGLANVGESKSQGASTITMQVARNFYLSTEKTFTRKIYEILLALKIESALPKEKILEIYMNQIFLGHRAYGFAAASEVYFGKPMKDLSVAEAAMLAGLPKAPSAYNPINNPRRAMLRQQYIIDRMLEMGFISPEQHAEAKAEKLRIRPPQEAANHAEYVAELARQLIFSQYGEEAYTRGLNVYLTLNADEQERAYRALRRGIMDYERRQVYRGPEAYVDLPADPKELDTRVAEALSDHPANDELLAAVVLEADPKRVLAALQSGETVTIVGEGLKPATSGLSDKGNPKTRIRRGAVIRVVKLVRNNKDEWTITQLPEVEGAMVALNPRDGSVRALVGGFDYNKNKFNHVTQAWRQPGSSFKPFIYSAALEKGFGPATVVNDSPLFFDASTTGSQPWEPKNYDGKFEGAMPLHTALAKSKNMVSIRILQAIGVRYAQDWITHFGFEADKHPAYLTMALGAGAVTPMQMAQAYSVFANGGYRITPSLVQRITDHQGRQLYQATPKPLADDMRAVEPRNAFMMSRLLQEVARSGTAARAQSTLKRPDLYGKTGTTNDSMDAWFAGYQPTLAAVVWIGYDQPRKLGDRETGGGLALPVWIEFMQYALRNTPVAEIPPTEGLVNLNGEWFYDEFSGNEGVRALTNDENVPTTGSEEEKKSILDLFKR
ncbi:penicillin-binding protein 1A [Roseateles amylovorans]|uniref:Penicillin-binding protein 1A n=1 Tax=Roseateles amylovorans TaxID=2978473 RepID=A0ABY6B1Q7_9BURK|nr:penicillin-binding protein 1A [Roseateles amylovorans]UXH79337.1 penicillin-binding protein 1A [Roseateles amylovorans]